VPASSAFPLPRDGVAFAVFSPGCSPSVTVKAFSAPAGMLSSCRADDAVKVTTKSADKHTLLRVWSSGTSHFLTVDETEGAKT
jgi:hypothetical protein